MPPCTRAACVPVPALSRERAPPPGVPNSDLSRFARLSLIEEAMLRNVVHRLSASASDIVAVGSTDGRASAARRTSMTGPCCCWCLQMNAPLLSLSEAGEAATAGA